MHSYLVEFWTKHDRNNSITTTMVTIDPDKLKAKIKHITGQENVELVWVKDDGI